jgi:hypothetical protein
MVAIWRKIILSEFAFPAGLKADIPYRGRYSALPDHLIMLLYYCFFLTLL